MHERYGLIVRTPSGTEQWHGTGAPEVGDVIAHVGRQYVVASVEPEDNGQVVITLDDAPEADSVPDPTPG